MDAEESTESENRRRTPKGVATAREAEARRGEDAPCTIACENTRERDGGLACGTGSDGSTDKLASERTNALTDELTEWGGTADQTDDQGDNDDQTDDGVDKKMGGDADADGGHRARREQCSPGE